MADVFQNKNIKVIWWILEGLLLELLYLTRCLNPLEDLEYSIISLLLIFVGIVYLFINNEKFKFVYSCLIALLLLISGFLMPRCLSSWYNIDGEYQMLLLVILSIINSISIYDSFRWQPSIEISNKKLYIFAGIHFLIFLWIAICLQSYIIFIFSVTPIAYVFTIKCRKIRIMTSTLMILFVYIGFVYFSFFMIFINQPIFLIFNFIYLIDIILISCLSIKSQKG